jgi:broad specificity phosphatase PhoE
MKVYFVRHGESTGNKEGIHQTPETPLSDTGRGQASRVAKRLKNHKIDLIYSSTHKRAMETAEIISQTIDVPVEYWGDLTELRNPSEIHNKPVNDPKIAKITELVKKNFGRENFKYSDEETFSELNERVGKVLSHLTKNHKYQDVICVSHASMTKAVFAKMIFGERLTAQIFTDLRYHLWSTNTGISVCEYGKEKIWRITSWNDASHL